MTTSADIDPRVWNAIAHAANKVFDRPYFSQRNRLAIEVVDALHAAGYLIVRMDDTRPIPTEETPPA